MAQFLATTAHFNPRPREEGDLPFFVNRRCVSRISIHALVKRATRHEPQLCRLPVNFNPRPREEGDLYTIDDSPEELISIHALVKRATKGFYASLTVKFDFNPRPREEGDRCFPRYKQGSYHFNPRPREEGDIVKSSTVLLVLLFQSTPS